MENAEWFYFTFSFYSSEPRTASDIVPVPSRPRMSLECPFHHNTVQVFQEFLYQHSSSETYRLSLPSAYLCPFNPFTLLFFLIVSQYSFGCNLNLYLLFARATSLAFSVIRFEICLNSAGVSSNRASSPFFANFSPLKNCAILCVKFFIRCSPLL